MTFSIKSLALAVLVVACAAMAWRTWYVESRRPPMPQFEDSYNAFAGDAHYLLLEDDTPLAVKTRRLVGTPGDQKWIYDVEFPDGRSKCLDEHEIYSRDVEGKKWFARYDAIRDSGRKQKNYGMGVEPLITHEQSFRIQGLKIDMSQPPRRLMAIRREVPRLLIGGKTAIESYVYSWVDLDTDLTILNPTIHDEIIGTFEQPRIVTGVYAYQLGQGPDGAEPMVNVVGGHFVNSTFANCALIDGNYYSGRSNEKDSTP